MLRWWPRTVKLITGQMQETALAATEQLLAKDTVPGPGISSEEDVGVGAEFQTTCIQEQGFSGQKDVPSLFSSQELQPGRALCSHRGALPTGTQSVLLPGTLPVPLQLCQAASRWRGEARGQGLAPTPAHLC